MVKRQVALLAVLLPAALLASCSFFFASPFPQHLAQVTNLRSMSGELPDTDGSQVTLKVMNNGTREFLFLQYRPPFANFKLLVLDTQLQIVSRHEVDPSDPNDRLGDLQLVRSDGGFVAGTVLLNVSGNVTGTSSSLSSYSGSLGFYTAVPEYRVFDKSSGRTYSTNYKLNSSFGFISTADNLIPLNSAGSYSLREIFHDVPADQVALYFQLDGSQRIEGVLYPASAFSAFNPFFSNPSHFTIDDVDPEHVHYTRDGTVIRSIKEGPERKRLKLIGFDGAVKAEFPDFEHRTVAAFAAEGDHYYFLDMEERMLYRANTWW